MRHRRNGTATQAGAPFWMLDLMFLTTGALVWLLFYFMLRSSIEGDPHVASEVITSRLPTAYVGESYRVELARCGTCAQVTWHLESGSADWLQIDRRTGSLSAASAVPDLDPGDKELPFHVAVRISSQCNIAEHRTSGIAKQISGVIRRREAEPPPLRLVTDSLPPAIADQRYRIALAALGGYPFADQIPPKYRWSQTVGAQELRQFGLHLDEDGILQGKLDPAAFHDSSRVSVDVAFQVTDSMGNVAQSDVTQLLLQSMVLKHDLRINLPSPEGRLPESLSGRPFHLALSAQGGEAPYRWAIKPESQKAWDASGLMCSQQGLLSAKSLRLPPPATTEADVRFQLVVRDAQDAQATASLTLPIRSLTKVQPVRALTESFPTAIAGEPYAFTLSARDGMTPYTWAGRGLPDGLQLSPQGVLSGIPTRPGKYAMTIGVEDAGGGRAALPQSPVQLVVREYAEILPLEILTPPQLPAAVVDRSYDLALAARGGRGKLSWQCNGAVLSNFGLHLEGEGQLASSKIVDATETDLLDLPITVSDEDGRSSQQTFKLPLVRVGFHPEPLRIVSDSRLPSVPMGTRVELALAATGGAPNYKWRVDIQSHEDLRDHLDWKEDGVLAIDVPALPAWRGRPPERIALSATVEDTQGRTDSREFVLFVVPGTDDVPPPLLRGGKLPAAIVGQPYWQPLPVVGGVPPYLPEVQGVLPSGLALDEENCVIHGTPEKEATLVEFRAVVTDMRGDSAAADFHMPIQSPLRPPGVPVEWWMEVLTGFGLLFGLGVILRVPFSIVFILGKLPPNPRATDRHTLGCLSLFGVLLGVAGGWAAMRFVFAPWFGESTWFGYLVIGMMIVGIVGILLKFQNLVLTWKGWMGTVIPRER